MSNQCKAYVPTSPVNMGHWCIKNALAGSDYCLEHQKQPEPEDKPPRLSDVYKRFND